MAGEHIQELNDENFEQTIASGITLVDFFTDWCGPCRTLGPIFEEVAAEMHQKAQFAKLNVDTGTAMATKHRVTSVPTLILFKEGQELHRQEGLRDAKAIKELVTSAF
ncbi:MAG: thioredoxin [Chlamydiota bacterium]